MLFLLVFLAAVQSLAQTSPAESIAEALAAAEWVGEGEVVEQTVMAGSERLETRQRFSVTRTLKGQSRDEIEFVTLGGEANGLGEFYTGLARAYRGRRYRAYCRRDENGIWRIQGGESGLVALDGKRTPTRNRTDGSNGEGDGAFLHWSVDQFPIPFTIARDSFIGRAAFVDAIIESFGAWRSVGGVQVEFLAMGCSDSSKNANDGVNNIILMKDRWPFDHSNVAITRNFYLAGDSERSGLILDSDILINAVDFEFTTTDEIGKYDLQNTLTHEVGHFLGLGHETSPTNTLATMYATTVPNETKKRSIEVTEVTLLREAYGGPQNSQDFPGLRCEVADGNLGCLSVPRQNGTAPLSAIMTVLGMGIWLSRRHLRRHRRPERCR